MAVKRNVKENGVVIAKEMKKATNEFKDNTGKTVPAQPDRYFLSVASSDNFDPVNGYVNPAIKDYRVDEKTFAKVKYLCPVRVTLEITEYGVRPVKDGDFHILEVLPKQG